LLLNVQKQLQGDCSASSLISEALLISYGTLLKQKGHECANMHDLNCHLLQEAFE